MDSTSCSPHAPTEQRWLADHAAPLPRDRRSRGLDLISGAAGQVLEQAINKIHRIDNAALIQELHAGTFNSIMGPVEFDKTGQNTLAVSYLDQWQQGQLIPVFPPSGAQSKPEYPKALWS